jgi:hypothetical protein
MTKLLLSSVLLAFVSAGCGGADGPSTAGPDQPSTEGATSTSPAPDAPEADKAAPEEAPAPAAGNTSNVDASFDDAFVQEATAAFEGFVMIMEGNQDDCPKMASELEAFMKEHAHIKQKVDAIEADPEQNEKWEAATRDSDKALEARMMPALQGCVNDPAMEALFKKMQ